MIAIAAIPLLQVFLTRTYYGKAMRATAQDWEAAEFSGINTKTTRLASFVFGSALAGLAGGLFSFTNSVTPNSGDEVLLPIILVVVIIGGIGSMTGTLVAGFLVGVVMSVSSLVALSLPSNFGQHADLAGLATFLIFLMVLMIKPTGLLGKNVVK
jgi:branched-chain amino acid transport system permease protein